jgi:hypothetical protein
MIGEHLVKGEWSALFRINLLFTAGNR